MHWYSSLLYRRVDVVVFCQKLCQSIGKYREEDITFHIQQWYFFWNVQCLLQLSLLAWKLLRLPANMLVSFLPPDYYICEAALGTHLIHCVWNPVWSWSWSRSSLSFITFHVGSKVSISISGALTGSMRVHSPKGMSLCPSMCVCWRWLNVFYAAVGFAWLLSF